MIQMLGVARCAQLAVQAAHTGTPARSSCMNCNISKTPRRPAAFAYDPQPILCKLSLSLHVHKVLCTKSVQKSYSGREAWMLYNTVQVRGYTDGFRNETWPMPAMGHGACIVSV